MSANPGGYPIVSQPDDYPIIAEPDSAPPIVEADHADRARETDQPDQSLTDAEPDEDFVFAPVEASVDEEMWAWAHTSSPDTDPRTSNRQVALILVVHNGAEWLPQALTSISRLESPPGAVVAVDASSKDDSRDVLNEALAAGTIQLLVDAPPDQGFGAAVAAAEKTIPPGFSWLWLLHDDAQVRPDTLTALRASLDQQPRPDLVYPKLLLPRLRRHSDRISEIGESLSATGDRYLSVEPGDLDQRQTEPEPVLGGSTCGLFIRRQAWRDLGGTDPGLPLFRDGLDLGWRANDVGLRVTTWPSAAIYHVQAGRGGMRETTITRDPERLDLVLGMRLAVARSQHPGRTRFAAVVHSVLRSIWLLLGRSPADAGRSLSAARVLLSHPNSTRELRQRHPHATEQAALRPTAWTAVRDLADRIAMRFGDAVRDLRDEPETGLDDLIGDDYAGGPQGPRWARPGPLVGLTMVVLALVAARHGWGTGHLVSSQLLPAPDSLGDAWRAAVRPLAGHQGSNAPWLLWSAVGSTLALGRPEFFVRLLVLLLPLWAYLSGARAATRVIGPGWRPNLVGFAWASLVVTSGVAARGSMAGAALAIVIPSIIALCYRWWEADDPGSAAEAWRAPALIAVLIAIAGSAYPLVLGSGVVLAIVMAVLLARDRGVRSLVGLDTWPGLALLMLGPGLVAAPWFTRLLSEPGRVLTGPDPLALPAGPAPAWWQVLLGRSVAGAGSGLPPWWVSLVVVGGLWLAVIYLIVRRALVRLPRQGSRAASWSPIGWSLAFVGFAGAAVLGRIGVQFDGVAVHGGTEPWILLGLGGLLLIAFSEFTPRQDAEAEQIRELARPVSLMMVALALVGMLWWVVGSASTPLRTANSALPAYVRDAHQPPRSARTLMVSITGGGASWSLVSERQPQWGSGEGSDPIDAEAARLAAEIASGTPGEDLASELASLGIAHVWLRGGSSDQVLALSNVPGLSALAADDNTMVWTVVGRVGVLTVEDGSTTTNLPNGEVQAGPSGRILRIAVPADPRWQVSVGEQPLTPANDTSSSTRSPGFEIGAATGPVHVRMAASRRESLVTGLGLVVLLVFSAPSASRDRFAGAPRRARRTR